MAFEKLKWFLLKNLETQALTTDQLDRHATREGFDHENIRTTQRALKELRETGFTIDSNNYLNSIDPKLPEYKTALTNLLKTTLLPGNPWNTCVYADYNRKAMSSALVHFIHPAGFLYDIFETIANSRQCTFDYKPQTDITRNRFLNFSRKTRNQKDYYSVKIIIHKLVCSENHILLLGEV